MTTTDLAKQAADTDLTSPRFRRGEVSKYWRKISFDFPILVMAISGIDTGGNCCEYFFRFELTGFPGTAPEAKIWDISANAPLATDLRPKGSERVVKAFQDWGEKSVYRPWDRHSGNHNNFSTNFPDLAWHSKRDLTFILEDIHGLLTSNAVSSTHRSAA